MSNVVIVPDIATLFTLHGSDKDTAHSYGPVYASLFAPVRHRVTAVLEIGVQWGPSLKAWRDYFGPGTRVVGVDISADPGEIEGVVQFRADSTDKERLDAVLGAETFDVVVDDGSHYGPHQLATWENLWPRVRPGGVYVVEDVQHFETALEFERLGATVFDLRGKKGRFDDVLVVFTKSGASDDPGRAEVGGRAE
jgi:23S rRNA U2552 (ribose-2'-O)-methylase RlmE/FtsJ